MCIGTLGLLCSLCASSVSAADPINLRMTPIVAVVEKTKDAVVYISSKKIVVERNTPAGIDPYFSQFFDFGQQAKLRGSLGSGFIVHSDGYIITNNHVIDRARQISVELLDGRKFEDVELISADPEADIAVLKIKTDKPLPALELGESSDLMIGEPVVAVGNPLGFSHSVSQGIVSALHRDLKAGNDKVVFSDLIQTDAAINPGNSGGPLLNIYGQVIGINTAIRGDAQNIGFAIQVNKLRDMIPELMSPAQVAKLDIPLKLVEKRKITPPANVEATIQRADGAEIISIAGQKPKNIVDAYAQILKQKAGQAFSIELKGQPEVKLTPKNLPPPEALAKAKQLLGLTVEPVTPRSAERYGLLIEDGIRVMAIDKASWGEKVGFQLGDVILQIGRFRVSTLDDFGYLLQQLQPGRQFDVRIMREGNISTARLTL